MQRIHLPRALLAFVATVGLLSTTACQDDVLAPTNDSVVVPDRSAAIPMGATVEVVHPGDLAGACQTAAVPNACYLEHPDAWMFYNDEADEGDPSLGSMVSGPGTPPAGDGSVQISVSGTQRRNLATYRFAGTPLADITEMRFSTYNASAGNGGGASRSAYLNFNVDLDGSDTWQSRLVFVPRDQGTVVQDSWQEWDAIDGGAALWKHSGGLWAGTKTWSQILSEYPNARFRVTDAHLGIRVGEPYNSGYTSNIDAFVFGTAAGTTVFDFEPDVEAPLVLDLAADPVPINGSGVVSATIDDATTGNSVVASASFSFDGGGPEAMTATDGSFDSATEGVSGSFTAPSDPGLYEVCVTGTDAAGNTGGPECTMVAVYDPSGGFVTGGGWIDSPAGAMSTLSTVWNQSFEADTDGWDDSDDGWYGSLSRVATGTNGVASSSGAYHAIAEGDASSAPFSRFDGYRDTWSGSWTAEVDVYLDPAWAAGEGFDYTVAASGSDGAHQRDYIFHVGVHADGRLLVNGSNNTDFTVNDSKLLNDGDGTPYEVTTAGWYTLQHVFYDDGGALAVDLNLLDETGTTVFTTTRYNAADLIPAEVGGNRYSWFSFISVADGIAIDDHELIYPVSPTGKATFGFNAKYKKGASEPDGNTQFTFKAGDLNFHSTSYEWLVVNQNGENAQFKGEGTVNGTGTYKFMLWAGDHDAGDTFRIRITEVGGGVVYDNGYEQELGGGSVIVHDGKGKK